MVIGKVYRESALLILFMYVFLLVFFIGGIVASSLFIEKSALKIGIISIISIFIILITYLPYYVYKSKKTPENVILYNVIDETITINGHKKKSTIKISEIVAITVHNIGTRLLLASRIEEGKLYFYLKDGTKIKTFDITSVYDTYNKLDEIVFKDREYDVYFKEQLIEKLDGWGSKKEYPSIISVLVSIFVPFIGLFFVSNQIKFKELKNGKASGLMAVALIISVLWVFIILLAVAFL